MITTRKLVIGKSALKCLSKLFYRSVSFYFLPLLQRQSTKTHLIYSKCVHTVNMDILQLPVGSTAGLYSRGSQGSPARRWTCRQDKWWGLLMVPGRRSEMMTIKAALIDLLLTGTNTRSCLVWFQGSNWISAGSALTRSPGQVLWVIRWRRKSVHFPPLFSIAEHQLLPPLPLTEETSGGFFLTLRAQNANKWNIQMEVDGVVDKQQQIH